MNSDKHELIELNAMASLAMEIDVRSRNQVRW